MWYWVGRHVQPLYTSIDTVQDPARPQVSVISVAPCVSHCQKGTNHACNSQIDTTHPCGPACTGVRLLCRRAVCYAGCAAAAAGASDALHTPNYPPHYVHTQVCVTSAAALCVPLVVTQHRLIHTSNKL